ncbi:MAG: aminopeptidase P family protein [Candidatus Hydrogenedentes bacterium]|nr:aminopeptidase P family protein [Candidatus Hydrogenedentota bacterium]
MTHRVDALRAILAESGSDAFFSLSPPTNFYLAGFSGTTSAVIITAKEAVLLCDFRYTEQAGTQVQGYAIEEVTGTLEVRVGECLNRLGVRKAAFEAAAHTVHQQQVVANAFSGALLPQLDLVRRLRCVKDEAEIEAIREASQLAEGVLAEVVPQIRAGMMEREIAAEIEYGFKRHGAQGPSFDTIALFGARSSLPHGMPGDRRLRPGDIVLLDFGCRRNGYCSDLTRTYAFGTIPGAWFEEIYDLTLTAQRIALEAIRPGMVCREVDAIARNLIADAGYGERFGHGLGHGVGIEIHESPRLNKESEAVLEPGMIVTVEPGIYLPGKGGVRIEDLVVVTKDGSESLSRTPKELKVLQE